MVFFWVCLRVFLTEDPQPHSGLSADNHMYQLKAHVVNSLLFSLLGSWTLPGRPTGSRRSITGLFRGTDQRLCWLWGLITNSLRASKSSSPQGQRQCTKTWQPVEIIYSMKVDGVDLKSIYVPFPVLLFGLGEFQVTEDGNGWTMFCELSITALIPWTNVLPQKAQSNGLFRPSIVIKCK